MDKMENKHEFKKVYEEIKIPKDYNFPERISESYSRNKKIKCLHKNSNNDIYQFPQGVVIVNKIGKVYDKLEISGNVEGNKLMLEEILGEKIS